MGARPDDDIRRIRWYGGSQDMNVAVGNKCNPVPYLLCYRLYLVVCSGGLEEGKVVPPRIRQHGQGAEGRVLDIHLHGAPHPKGGNWGRGLHDVEVAVLVPRVDEVAAGRYGPGEEGEVAKQWEAGGHVEVRQVDEEEEDGQGSGGAGEDLVPEDVLAVLVVDEDVEGEVADGHGGGVQDGLEQGRGLVVVVVVVVFGVFGGGPGGLGRGSAVLEVELALALVGELEQRLARGTLAIGMPEDHVDALFVQLGRRLEGGRGGGSGGFALSAALLAIAAHGWGE